MIRLGRCECRQIAAHAARPNAEPDHRGRNTRKASAASVSRCAVGGSHTRNERAPVGDEDEDEQRADEGAIAAAARPAIVSRIWLVDGFDNELEHGLGLLRARAHRRRVTSDTAGDQDQHRHHSPRSTTTASVIGIGTDVEQWHAGERRDHGGVPLIWSLIRRITANLAGDQNAERCRRAMAKRPARQATVEHADQQQQSALSMSIAVADHQWNRRMLSQSVVPPQQRSENRRQPTIAPRPRARCAPRHQGHIYPRMEVGGTGRWRSCAALIHFQADHAPEHRSRASGAARSRTDRCEKNLVDPASGERCPIRHGRYHDPAEDTDLGEAASHRAVRRHAASRRHGVSHGQPSAFDQWDRRQSDQAAPCPAASCEVSLRTAACRGLEMGDDVPDSRPIACRLLSKCATARSVSMIGLGTGRSPV